MKEIGRNDMLILKNIKRPFLLHMIMYRINNYMNKVF